MIKKIKYNNDYLNIDIEYLEGYGIPYDDAKEFIISLVKYREWSD